MPKRSIREQLLSERKRIAPEVCRELSQGIQSRLVATKQFEHARSIALYSPILNEVETSEVAVVALRQGKRLLYPKVAGTYMDFVSVDDLAELRPGCFGVLEPEGGAVVPLLDIDLLVVPGVAFDLAGHRLGYGKGYYDRILDDGPDLLETIGLAYDFQVVACLPVEGHDRPLAQLITERRHLHFG